MTFLVRVQRVVQETPEVRLFELVDAQGGALPSFTPGAHIDVQLPGGVTRQYSLCNGPDDTAGYLIGVKREAASRGGSVALHEQVKEGDALRVSAPRNNFALCEQASRHVLLGAGIGITPLLSMARHLLARGASFELHYFARSIELAAFQADLSGPAYAGRVNFHCGLDAEGVQAALQQILSTRGAGAHLYLCGPRPFMAAVRDVASNAWPADAVHFEYFSADEAALSAPKDSFVVRLAKSGGEYVVPADQSIVEALGQHGVDIYTSCERGVCGSCLTGVVEGRPDHRDSFLTEAERRVGDKLLPCVSRSCCGLLVLDL